MKKNKMGGLYHLIVRTDKSLAKYLPERGKPKVHAVSGRKT